MLYDRSVVGRSFAGFACGERIGEGPFGAVFRARNTTGVEGRVIVVDDELAARDDFAATLTTCASDLLRLEHANLLSLRAAGRGRDGSLVVVTDPLADGLALSELLARRSLPVDVALGIAAGVFAGLAHAHVRGHCHGGVHPRSVFLEGDGRALLTDFALARALLAAAARGDGGTLLAGTRGYLAPELSLGQEPDARSDIHACGALLMHLVAGEPTAGDAPLGEALIQVVATASASSADERYADARELGAALFAAAEADGFAIASPAAIAAFVRATRPPGDAHPDEETAGVLAGLTGAAAGRRGAAADDAPGGGAVVGAASLRPQIESGRSVEEVLADLEGGGQDFEGDLTEVDEDERQDERLSQILRMSEGEVHAAPAKRGEHDDFDFDETPLPTPRPLGEFTTSIATSAAGSGVALPQERGLFWWAVIVFVVASVGAVLYTQRDRFLPGRAAARDGDVERQRRRSLAEYERSQLGPGEVVITSKSEGAAVWLLLGRAPIESFPLASSRVHQLRLEHDGYHPLDLQVTGQHWIGGPSARRALLAATLVPDDPDTPPPAAPPAPETPPDPGPGGPGVIAVESTPPGAEVWLLVGFTPEARVSGLPSGNDFDFKVLKDGHRPAYATVRAGDWFLSGPDGPVVPSVSRQVELQAVEGASERRRRRARRRGKRR